MEFSQASQKAVTLNITYGIQQEIRQVLYTIKKLSWFAEQGYFVDRIKLPGGVTKDSSDDDVVRAITAEYSDAAYAERAAELQQEWSVISVGFEKMRSESSFHLEKEYGVVLTKYGIGGSYNAETAMAVIKISTQSEGSRVGTVAHEVVHMTIQYLIDQYHVRHWRKERLVDLLMEHFFPGLKRVQTIKEDVSKVDQAFENLFPDMNAIAQSIGEPAS